MEHVRIPYGSGSVIPLETALSVWEGALSTGNRAVNPYGKRSLPLDKAKYFF